MSRFSKWAQTEHSPGARIIALIPAGAIFLAFLPYLFLVICPSLDQRLLPHSPKHGVATLIIGGILIAVGMFFGLWSIQVQFTRGRGTPLPMMPTQGLLTTGPFRYCRNPMTLGTVLAYLIKPKYLFPILTGDVALVQGCLAVLGETGCLPPSGIQSGQSSNYGSLAGAYAARFPPER